MTEKLSFLTTLPDRAVVAVTGLDARSFLQRVITRGPDVLNADHCQISALLTPQGKILVELFVFDDGDGGLFIDVAASEAESLIKRLTLYRLRADAQITRRDDLCVGVALGSGEAELKLVALSIAPDPRSELMGLRAITPAGAPDDEAADYHQSRIAAGLAELGQDFGPGEVFSTDVNHDLTGAVDYKKGCFVGQEVASRMHRKGGVRKRTVILAFDADAPAIGTAVRVGETEVGALTSASEKQALALVRLDRLAKALESGESVTVDGEPARLVSDLSTL